MLVTANAAESGAIRFFCSPEPLQSLNILHKGVFPVLGKAFCPHQPQPPLLHNQMASLQEPAKGIPVAKRACLHIEAATSIDKGTRLDFKNQHEEGRHRIITGLSRHLEVILHPPLEYCIKSQLFQASGSAPCLLMFLGRQQMRVHVPDTD